MDQAVPPISDANTPSAGRIYDYFLGGRHNFEVDRVAAKAFLKDVPAVAEMARLIRWFLGAAIRQFVNDGFTKFLDFASGLPTVDHIHQVAPSGTKVVYSDIDPITVAYAQEIVKDLPDVAFVQADAGKPESLLDSPIIEKLFGTDRKIAIGFNGIAWFLPDDRIAHALSVLYDWADPGSKLYISDTRGSLDTPQGAKIDEFYKQVKEPVYSRTEAKFQELIGKWKVCEPGIKNLEDWLPIDKTSVAETAKSIGGNLVGAILEKT